MRTNIGIKEGGDYKYDYDSVDEGICSISWDIKGQNEIVRVEAKIFVTSWGLTSPPTPLSWETKMITVTTYQPPTGKLYDVSHYYHRQEIMEDPFLMSLAAEAESVRAEGASKLKAAQREDSELERVEARSFLERVKKDLEFSK